MIQIQIFQLLLMHCLAVRTFIHCQFRRSSWRFIPWAQVGLPRDWSLFLWEACTKVSVCM